MRPYDYTLHELADKLDYEGGLGEGFFYFGREVNSESEELNEKWRAAYDAIEAVRALIPEPYTGPEVSD